jgi:hypothetical protein
MSKTAPFDHTKLHLFDQTKPRFDVFINVFGLFKRITEVFTLFVLFESEILLKNSQQL